MFFSEESKKKSLKAIKKIIKAGDYRNGYAKLSEIAASADDYTLQSKYAKRFSSIPVESLELRPIKIALLSSSTIEHFADILRFWMGVEGFDAEIYLSEFDTIHQTILDTTSPLYSFKPDIVWVFTNYRDVKFQDLHGSSPETVVESVQSSAGNFVNLWNVLEQNGDFCIIQNNADLPIIRTFGNYEGTALWSQLNYLRRFNLEIAEKAIQSGVTIFDYSYICSLYGKERWHNHKYWYHSKHAFDLNAIGSVAFQGAKLISSIKGQAKKCIVLDLDNTLWGGVIGDDGLDGIKLGNGAVGEAFCDFQRYIKRLKERGIILTICSKNEDENAKEPFLKHPDMQLTLEDIAVFKANWTNKADNIRQIASILNIGLDSMVFVDDNPAERALVRGLLPAVCVPAMPDDPSEYIATLNRECLFETISFSQEDQNRADSYSSNAKRVDLQEKFSNLADFLKHLEMESEVGVFDEFHLPRIVQLINKSNQFHLTTTRYTEAQVKTLVRSDVTLYFKLKDRLGDNGLISVLILKLNQAASELVIDTWVMSCRVLSRGMEEFIMHEIISQANKYKCKRIIGKYIPTKKNKLVSELYQKLGFTLKSSDDETTIWHLKLESDPPHYECYIKHTYNK